MQADPFFLLVAVAHLAFAWFAIRSTVVSRVSRRGSAA